MLKRIGDKLIFSYPRLEKAKTNYKLYGNFDQALFLETVLTKEMTIAPEKEVPYHIDGEIRFGMENLVEKIEPRALTLKGPQVYPI